MIKDKVLESKSFGLIINFVMNLMNIKFGYKLILIYL